MRLAAGALSASLPTAEAAALLLDQLLDDAASVRCAALQELGRRRLPGWQQALGDSLRDPDSIIALQAVQVLGDNLTPDATALLKEAAKTLSGLKLSNLEVPSGKHKIVLRISDSQGRTAEKEIIIKVE